MSILHEIETRQADSALAIAGREILGRKVKEGLASAKATMEHVHAAIPTDAIVAGPAFSFHPSPGLALTFGSNTGHGSPDWCVDARTIHPHALTQLAGTAGVPGAYLAELASSTHLWQRELATRTLSEFFAKGEPSRKRYLARSVGAQVRGVLSDRFRRLDSRPLLDAFAETCQEIGAVPIEGHATDLRVAVKALLPVVFEPVPGEVLCLGVEWGNSDFGAARHSVRAFIYRLWCANGATMEDVLSQVHLGGRLSEDIKFSTKTYQLDTLASVSALRDVVKGTLGPKKVDSLLGTIKAAHEQKIEWKGAAAKLARKLTKGELDAAKTAFESNDVVNLPAEKSIWRVSNAISWIAGQSEVSEDRRLELQRCAGEILDGRIDKADKAA